MRGKICSNQFAHHVLGAGRECITNWTFAGSLWPSINHQDVRHSHLSNSVSGIKHTSSCGPVAVLQTFQESRLVARLASSWSLLSPEFQRLTCFRRSQSIESLCFQGDGKVVLFFGKSSLQSFQRIHCSSLFSLFFSNHCSLKTRFGTWRKLWLTLAIAEKQLGLNIPDAAIEEMKANLVRDQVNQSRYGSRTVLTHGLYRPL